MTRYIVEYMAGTKGDMLVRFLNKMPPGIIDQDDRRTVSAPIGMVNWLKSLNPKKNTVERSIEVLYKNTNKFIGAHELFHFGKNQEFDQTLEQLDYKVIKIVFGRRYYKTIIVESIIKNFSNFDETEENYPVQIENMHYLNDKNHINSFFGLYSHADFNYKNKKSVLALIDYLLDRLPELHISPGRLKKYDIFNGTDLNNKIIFDYEKLYINKDLSGYSFFDGLDMIEYSRLVDLSFPEKIINIYGKQYDLSKYGYLKDYTE